ncbi:MAG: tetratricopeptide repeat protein [Candidatus Thorarchaeota archaeon]|jgi:tetratricopeptide (TPR) repeat protein
MMTDPYREELSRAKVLQEKGELADSLEIVDSLLSSKEIKDSLLILDALIFKAEISWRSGKLEVGLSAVERAENLLLSDELNQLEEELLERKSKLLSHTGIIHWYRGELEQAKDYHEESLRLNEERDDKEGISTSLNNLGLVYWTKGDFDQATDYYKQGLAISEELDDENAVARILNNLANICATNGELDQALEYIQQSLEIKERLSTKMDLSSSLVNIGVIYRLMGDLEKATEYYNKSLAIQKDLSIGPEFALALHNLGEVYSIKGELDYALEFFQRSLLIYDDMGAKEGTALALGNIGECHRRKGNPESAVEYYQRSLTISEDMGNSRLMSSVLRNLVSLSLDSGDSDLAKEYLTKLKQIRDKYESKIINHQFQISKALILKKSRRTRDRGKAEEILEQVVEEDIADHTLTTTAMIHLCDLLLFELKATREEEVLAKVKGLTKQLVTIGQDQASHPLVVETYLLQSKLALIEFEIKEAQGLMLEAKNLADEKGLQRLSQIVQNEIDTLQHEVKKWESILDVKPSKQEMVNLTNLDDLLARMVQKTVENLGVDSSVESGRTKYKLIHKDLLKGTGKSEKSKFRVGIAQMGLSEEGDILSELYEEKAEGLIGLREEAAELTRTKLKDMVEKAHAEKVNILLFPEMTIDLSYDTLVDDVTKLTKQYDMYIIPGSFHDQDSKRNVCRIFGPDGVLWEQEKHIPAIIHIGGKRFIERIDVETETKNTFIFKTEYGRIAITICRDFLDMDLRVELKNSDPPVDLVINPAFTPVTADFKAAHFDARRSIYAYCFFANVAEFGDSLIYTPERDRIERNIPGGQEGIIYKDVDLFALRAERKKWEKERKKQVSFIQSTR